MRAARAAMIVPVMAMVIAAEERVEIKSTLDGAMQPALISLPGAGAPVPLLVHLHSWSSHFDSSESLRVALDGAVKRGWAFISPEFRGPNDKPEACASPQARQDVLDAVDYMVRRGRIDERRIYLLGGSGGGHMALVMAAHAPKRWRAVSAWVPITDLAAWHAESAARGAKYAAMMEKCCGGKPDDAAAREQYRLRSPLPFLAAAKGLPIAIETGISDGHTARPGLARPANWGGSVPVSHSLRAFNALAEANGYPKERLAEAEIRFITEKAELPEHLKTAVAADEIRKHGVAFRRAAGPVVLTLFMGGHETDFEAALQWLAGK